MIRRNRKTRKYHAPSAKVTQMALESNFCQTLRLNAQVDQIRNVNADSESEEAFYFDF